MSERGYNRTLVWFRRDLRAYDHAALYHALEDSSTVHCVFVFDIELLDSLPRRDRRVEFIYGRVARCSRAWVVALLPYTVACATKC